MSLQAQQSTNAQTTLGRVEILPLGGESFRVRKGTEILGDITKAGRRWITDRTSAEHRSRTIAIEALIQKHRGLA